MATFSQQFLANLGRPAMTESLFGLGRTIGGLPGQAQERKKKEQELQAFNQMAQASEQGTAAALEGNVEGVKQRIAQLSQARDAAEDLPTKQNIQRAIDNLQRQLPGAKKISVGNKARELVNIEQQLASLPLSATTQRLALQERQKRLQQDPEAMRQYQQYQLDTFRYEQAEKEVQAEQWLNSNRALMLEAIEAGDTDKLTSIIEGAGDFVGAAQRFSNAALQSKENMAKFEENSMEQKTGPSVDYYTEQVNNLPEEVNKNLKVILEAYARVSEEGWDGKQWNTGARIRAKRLENELQSQLKMFSNQLAISEYNRGVSEERRKQEEIKKLELQIGLPMSSEYLEEARRQVSSMSDREDITEDKIRQQAEYLYNLDQKRLREQLAALTGEEPVEEEDFSVMVGDNLTTSSMVREAISRKGEKSVVKQLRDNGVSEEDIESLIGKKPDKAEELGILDQRIEKQKRRFSDELGTRDERMAALGTREQRMAALPR
jgi:hypothetical protein